MVYVYWYHLPTHTDPYTEGYVGVTTKLDIRHRYHHRGYKGGSVILHNALKKHGDAIQRSILHEVASVKEAYEIENSYRPLPETGWNIAIGGGLPPDTTGRKDSPEVCAKRNASQKATKAQRTYVSGFKGTTGRWSESQRKAIGHAHKGKTISTAHREAISAKMSGGNSPKAKEIFLVHKDKITQVHKFPCIKSAADALSLKYHSIRSHANRAKGYTSNPSRNGWIVLGLDVDLS